MISNILKYTNMTTIAPEMNRHGHFGVYGWSSNGVHMDNRGKVALFNNISHHELYNEIKNICLNGEKLLKMNQNKNPGYFWDFDPNIDFDKLEYVL
jgi:hypothetical protein